ERSARVLIMFNQPVVYECFCTSSLGDSPNCSRGIWCTFWPIGRYGFFANKCAALLTLALTIAITFPLGFLPCVDNSAHIEGFLSGFPLGFILLILLQFGHVTHKKFL
ncbi:hypothetical protein SO802_010985, partial [Lithocarpus litseifolius]